MENSWFFKSQESHCLPTFSNKSGKHIQFLEGCVSFRVLDNEESWGTKQPLVFNMCCTLLLCRFLYKCPCLSHHAYLGIVDSWKWDNHIIVVSYYIIHNYIIVCYIVIIIIHITCLYRWKQRKVSISVDKKTRMLTSCIWNPH